MSHIFISYSRSDLAVVDQIAAAMIEKLIPIWMDRVGITGGDQWRRQIVEAIEDCDAFLLVLSNSAVVSDNVRKEVDLAEHFNKRIIPVEIELTNIPRELSYQLIGIQRIDMIDDTAGKLPNLLSLLVQFHQSIQHSATEKTSAPPAAPAQVEPSTPESAPQQAASSTETAPEVSPYVSEVPPAMPVPASAAEMATPVESIQEELEPELPTTLPDEERPAAGFEPIRAATAAPSAAFITAEPGTAVPEAPIQAAPEPIPQDAQSVETSFFKRLPLAAWVGGAAGLVVIVALILGLSGVFGGGRTAQQAAQPNMEAALLVESTATEARNTEGLAVPEATEEDRPEEVALSGAQSDPTQTPVPTEEPKPTPTQTSEPTIDPMQDLLMTAKQWNILFSDDFSTDQGIWFTGASSDGRRVREIRAGKLYWEFVSEEYTQLDVSSTVVDELYDQIKEFYVAVDVQQTSGSRNPEHGLVVAWENETNNRYYFLVDDDRQYVVKYRDAVNDEYVEIIPYTYASPLRPHRMNRLAVIGQGTHLYLFINDEFITQVEYQPLSANLLGIRAVIFDEDNQASWEFDNFEIRVP